MAMSKNEFWQQSLFSGPSPTSLAMTNVVQPKITNKQTVIKSTAPRTKPHSLIPSFKPPKPPQGLLALGVSLSILHADPALAK